MTNPMVRQKTNKQTNNNKKNKPNIIKDKNDFINKANMFAIYKPSILYFTYTLSIILLD